MGFIDGSNILSGVAVAGISALSSYIAYKTLERWRKIETFIEYEEKSGYKIKIAGEERFVSKKLGKLIKKTQTDEKAKQLQINSTIGNDICNYNENNADEIEETFPSQTIKFTNLVWKKPINGNLH